MIIIKKNSQDKNAYLRTSLYVFNIDYANRALQYEHELFVHTW